MATIVKARYTDFSALRFNGIDKDVWIRNPTFKDATTGAFATWVRFPEILTGNGSITIRSLGNAGAGDYLLFLLRRNTNSGSTVINNLDVLQVVSGALKSKSGTTAISANTWVLAGRDSSGDLWLNGAKEGVQYWRPVGQRDPSGWYGAIPGATKDLSFGASRNNGTVTLHGRIDMNDSYEFSAPLTAPEWAELYAAGMGADPRLLSPGLVAKIINAWDFEKRLTPVVGSLSNTFTGVNIVPADYITP